MAWDVYHNFVQRWKQQAGEWRQRQLLKLDKPRVVRRLYIPSIARGLLADDPGDPKVRSGRAGAGLLPVVEACPVPCGDLQGVLSSVQRLLLSSPSHPWSGTGSIHIAVPSLVPD